MIFQITILWWYLPLALFVIGFFGGILIMSRANGYDFGTPFIGMGFWLICWAFAAGILIGNCK